MPSDVSRHDWPAGSHKAFRRKLCLDPVVLLPCIFHAIHTYLRIIVQATDAP